MSGLLPPWVTSIRDAPWTLFHAIRDALLFLSFEEYPADEQPPRSIWLNRRKLKEHFDEVRRERNRRFDSHDKRDEIEDPVDNPAARELLIG